MTTETKYKNKIQRFAWDDLLDLWEKIKAGNTPGWEPGKAFEYLVLRAFQIEGAHVEWPYTVTIGELTGTETGKTAEQIDGFIYAEGLACLVECKDEKAEVDIEPIYTLRSQLLRRPSAAIGAVFSHSGFTGPADLLARFVAPQTILLWNDSDVEFALQNKWFCKGLADKYRFCVAKGIPTHNISREDEK